MGCHVLQGHSQGQGQPEGPVGDEGMGRVSLLVVLGEAVPEPSVPCLTHHEDFRDRRSRRFLPWNTGMNTRKVRAKVPRKKRICCTRSPASMGRRTGKGISPPLPLPGAPGFGTGQTWFQTPALPLLSCATLSKLFYLSEPWFLPL